MLIHVVCDGIHVLSTQAHDYCVIIIHVHVGLSALMHCHLASTCTIINASIIARVIQGVSHIILHVLILYTCSYFVLIVFML